MNCILAEKSAIEPDNTIILNDRQSLHIIDVLKKGVGDLVLAGIVDGPIGMTMITAIDGNTVIIETPKGDIPPRPPVHVILGMPRPRVMKRLWMSLSSIGVSSITVIGGKKVEPYYFASHSVKEDVYRPQLIEGLEQARDTRMPDVNIIKSFHWFSKKHLPDYPDSWTKIICHPGAGQSIRDAVKLKDKTEAVIAVGPEGGWTNRELALFQEHGFVTAGLHDRSLRTDTAIISLLALTYDSLSSPAAECRSYSDTAL